MNLGIFVKLIEILSVPFFGRRQKPAVLGNRGERIIRYSNNIRILFE